MSLFDKWLEDAKKAKIAKDHAEQSARPKGQKCSTCHYHCGHAFSPKYHYCGLGRSKHTPNGYAKTKASGWCNKWKPK